MRQFDGRSRDEPAAHTMGLGLDGVDAHLDRLASMAKALGLS